MVNFLISLTAVFWGGEIVAQRQPLFHVRDSIVGLDYVNVSGSREQLPILEQNGQGIGVIDFDGDGLQDLFITNGGTEAQWRQRKLPGCRLYRNLGQWRFEDVTGRAGVKGNEWSIGVAVADYDADGDFDIYVLNWGPNALYSNNGNGTFADVTSTAGVGDPRWSSSAAFADFNGDGLLDLYVSNYVAFDFDKYPKQEKNGSPCLYRGIETGCGPWCYEGERDTLYINTGGGRFEDRSIKAGLECTAGFRGFGVVAADLDNDADMDVYVGCDVMPNLHLVNDGSGRFTSVGLERGGALNAAGQHESGMGVAAADFDGNGDLDVFATNFSDEKNTFYRNNKGVLSDDSATIGLDRHLPEMGWGILAQDFDQDRLIDIFIANGHIYPQLSRLDDSRYQYAQPPRLFRQKSGGVLAELDGPAAIEPPLTANLRGCTAGDLDNDGDLDIVAIRHNGPLLILENLSNRPAITVELTDARGGKSPMGARVSVNGATQTLLPNQGYQSSNNHRLHFPISSGTTTLEVEVVWPNGQRQKDNRPATSGKTVMLRQPVSP